MLEKDATAPDLEFHPLTTDRWSDLEELFGEQGAYGGCWCMWWRITRSQFQQQTGDGNRRALQRVVASGEVPGILAYDGEEPVGWCSVAPRETFGALNRSRILRRLDETPVWSIVCFYVAPAYRRRGLTDELIRGAIDYVRDQGGTMVEAYPTAPRGRRLQAVSSYMGVPAVFERMGFCECARPSQAKVVMRRRVL